MDFLDVDDRQQQARDINVAAIGARGDPDKMKELVEELVRP